MLDERFWLNEGAVEIARQIGCLHAWSLTVSGDRENAKASP
jgi:hypothetical protein